MEILAVTDNIREHLTSGLLELMATTDDIDCNLHDVLQKLVSHGITPLWSCEGHPETGDMDAYISVLYEYGQFDLDFIMEELDRIKDWMVIDNNNHRSIATAVELKNLSCGYRINRLLTNSALPTLTIRWGNNGTIPADHLANVVAGIIIASRN